MTDQQKRFFHDMVQPALNDYPNLYIGSLYTQAASLDRKPVFQEWGKAGDIDSWLERLEPVMSVLPHSINFTPVLRDKTTSKAESVKCATMLWVDIDNFLWEDWSKGRIKALKGTVCEPSVYINSGWGVHLYWFLNKPLDLKNKAALAAFEKTSAILAWMFCADIQSSGAAAHLMRFPGSYNCKSDPYYKATEIIYTDRGRVDFDKFSATIVNCAQRWLESNTLKNNAEGQSEEQSKGGAETKERIEQIKNILTPKAANRKSSKSAAPVAAKEVSVREVLEAIKTEASNCPLLDMAANHSDSIGYFEWMAVGCGLAKIFGKSETGEKVFYELSLPGNTKSDPERDIIDKFRSWSASGLMPTNCTTRTRMSVSCPKAGEGCKSILTVLSKIARNLQSRA